jgi:hypothetical protein
MKTENPLLFHSPHEYRGFTINEFTKLERALDKHLLNKFFPNSSPSDQVCYQMHEVLLDRLTFDGKRTAVKGLLDQRELNSGFVKTKNNSFKHGKLIDEVRQLIEIRNYFAHYLMVVDNANSDSVLTLLQFRDSTKLIVYTQGDFEKLIHRILQATSDLLDLLSVEKGL